MLVNSDASALQLVHKHIYRRCVLISCYNHAVDFEVVLSEYVDKPHNLKVVCNSEVLSCLACSYISRVNADYDFSLIAHSLKKLDFGVFIKAGQYSHCMLVVYKLASELKVQSFRIAFVDTFSDMRRLFLKIFLCTKSDFL